MDAAARRSLGARGEDAVADWYRGAHYEVLTRNWRCPEGELDVVAYDSERGVIVFCEVKTRASTRFGPGFEAVTPAKQQRLRRLAGRWLAGTRHARDSRYAQVRFDVASVTVSAAGAMVVDVLEDAF